MVGSVLSGDSIIILTEDLYYDSVCFSCSPNAKLTVGARALAKHCHRDDSLQWWGKCTGCKINHAC